MHDKLPRVFAIIPAAGRSRRMGTAKQLLPIHGRPLLVHVIGAHAGAGLAGTLVVTQRLIAEQLKDALPAGVLLEFNDDPATEMIDSVRTGIRRWNELQMLTERDGFMVCPGDMPAIRTADLQACRTVFEATPDRIVVAEYQARGGHPLIFPTSLAPFVASAACDRGLNALARQFAGRVTRVPRPSLGIMQDLDVPEDLSRFSGLDSV